MTRLAKYGCLAASAFALLGGCSDPQGAYWRSERYLLLAIGSRGAMSLSFDEGGRNATGLVGPTVFSIGADKKYIVLMQHPSTDASGGFDRSITNYFVVERTSSPDWKEREKGVRGPLMEEDFAKLAVSLNLPKFTTTFDDLK
jgi:hypothetical protein